MRSARLPLALLLTAALLPAPAAAQDAAADGMQAAAGDTLRPISPAGAMLRSALLPGWGQLYTDHPIKAAAALGSAGWVLSSLLESDRRVRDLVDERDGVTDPALRAGLASEIETRRDRRRTWIYWTAVTWLFWITDAFVDAHLYHFDEIEPDFEARVGPTPGSPGLQLCLTLPVGGGGR
ncbi:MAG: DUF5683 domain-containing protein [bacterium]